MTLLGSAAITSTLGCRRNTEMSEEAQRPAAPRAASKRLPTIFVPHGGGPWPFVKIPGMDGKMESLREYLVGLPQALPEPPKTLLVISAHWEENVPTVQTAEAPPMLYDYSGFPPESYEITWPAPGDPDLAQRVRAALGDHGMESGEAPQRGYDHGTFVATKLMYPSAEVPTIQLSLTRDLDPKRLFEIGRALSPLRDQGVLILGSGYSYHNMRGFFSAMAGDTRPTEDSKAFDLWLAETLQMSPSQRQTRLLEWEKAPRARACHPREEHLLPLMVCAGAGAEDSVTLPYHEALVGVHTLAAHFS